MVCFILTSPLCNSGAVIRTGSVLFFGLGRLKSTPAPGRAAEAETGGGKLRVEAAVVVAAFLGGGRRSPPSLGCSPLPFPLAAASGMLTAEAWAGLMPGGGVLKPLMPGGGPIRKGGGGPPWGGGSRGKPLPSGW